MKWAPLRANTCQALRAGAPSSQHRTLPQLPGALGCPGLPVGVGRHVSGPQAPLTARGTSVATRSGVLPGRKARLSLNGTSLLIFSRSSPRTWAVRLGSTASDRHRAQVRLWGRGHRGPLGHSTARWHLCLPPGAAATALLCSDTKPNSGEMGMVSWPETSTHPSLHPRGL